MATDKPTTARACTGENSPENLSATDFSFPKFMPAREYQPGSLLNEVPLFWASPQFHFAFNSKCKGYDDHCQLGAELAAHYVQYAQDTKDESGFLWLSDRLLDIVLEAPAGVRGGFFRSIERLLVDHVDSPFAAVKKYERESFDSLIEDVNDATNSQKGRKNNKQRPCHWPELICTDTSYGAFPADAVSSLLLSAIDSLLLVLAAEGAGGVNISTRFGGVSTALYQCEAAQKIALRSGANNIASACDLLAEACLGLTRIINDDLDEEFPASITEPAIQLVIDQAKAVDEDVYNYHRLTAVA